MPHRRWVRVTDDALVYIGPCLVHNIIATPAGNNEYHEIYDGRDTTSGKLFCRIETAQVLTRPINLGQGVPFDVGIYVAVENLGDAVTIVFTPLGE